MSQILERQKVEIYTCSKCGRPNASDPARCCSDGDFHGQTKLIEIPKLSGRYFTEFFDYERNPWELEKNGIGRIYRASILKEKIITLIYKGEKYRISELIDSLEKIYTYYREDRPHNAECEFALEDDCICWCVNKYHGLKGRGAEQRG